MALPMRGGRFPVWRSCVLVLMALTALAPDAARAQNQPPSEQGQRDPLREANRIGNKISNFLKNADQNQAQKAPDSTPPSAQFTDGLKKPTAVGEDIRAVSGENRSIPAKGAAAETPAAAGQDEPGTKTGKTLNVLVNVGQFAECMQRRTEKVSKAVWSMGCLKEQASSYIQDAATGATMETIAFYAPRLGLVGQATISAYGVYVAGGQMGDAVVEGIQWWDALSEEAQAGAFGEAAQRDHVARFARQLAAEESWARNEAEWILGERQKLADDIERLGKEQKALAAKAPPPDEYKKRVAGFMRQLIDAGNDCKNTTLNAIDGSQNRLQELALEQALDQAMRLAKSCKSAEEGRQADEAWRRAGELQKGLATDPTETLISDASLYGNAIKEMVDEAGRITREKAAIPARIRELETRVKQMNPRHENFLKSFPPDLIDMVKLNSGRIQQIQKTIDRAIVGGRGEDVFGIKRLDFAYAAIAPTSLEGLRAYTKSTENYPRLVDFTYVFETLLFDVARCRGAHRTGSGERGKLLFAEAEKNYRSLRGACGTKLGEPARQPEPVVIACNTISKAGTNPPQTITVNVGRVAGTVRFSYDMYRVPDHMEVQYGGQVVADTGCVSGRNTLAIALSGASDQVTVVVKPACQKSESTRWDFTLGCPGAAGPAGAAAIASSGPAAGGMSLHEKPVGDVRYYTSNPAEAKPLQHSSEIANGVSVQTGDGAQAVLKSPADTRVIVTEGSLVKFSAGPGGGQKIELLRGAVEIHRRQGLSGNDDVGVETEDGAFVATGTRYRVEKMASGTRIQVFEGSVRVTGGSIIKIYASNVERGKPSPATELMLQAGEQALVQKTTAYTAAARGSAAPASAASNTGGDRLPPPPQSPPFTRPETPWNDPQVQQLIDEWLRNAKPAVRSDLPGPWRFSEWGQVLGPGSKAAGAPDHPSGWTRHQSLWQMRMRFDSLNLCSMGEYIERRLAGKGLEACDKSAGSALPAWLAPSAAPAQTASDGTGSKAANAIAAARAQVKSIQAPPPQNLPATQVVPALQQPPSVPPPVARPLLDKIDAIPPDQWVAGKPDFNASGFRKLLVLVAQVYDPRLPNCAIAAQREGITVIGFSARNELDTARWGGLPPFPVALGYRARDALYAIEVATGRQPIHAPIPLNFAYLLDRDGRVLDSGYCESVVNKLVGRDIGIPGGRR